MPGGLTTTRTGPQSRFARPLKRSEDAAWCSDRRRRRSAGESHRSTPTWPRCFVATGRAGSETALAGSAWVDFDLIIETGLGLPWSDASRAFGRLPKRGFSQVRNHDLRHAFASSCWTLART